MNTHAEMRSLGCGLVIGVIVAASSVAPVRAQQRDADPSGSQPPSTNAAETSSATNPSVRLTAPAPVATHDASMQMDPSSPDNEAHREDHRAAGSEQSDHVAPPPPHQTLDSMSAREMTRVMEMDDSANLAMLKLDRLERDDGNGSASTAWKLAAWVGSDFDKVLFRSEGEHTRGEVDHADAEILWDHAVASFWNTQLGVRHDFGVGPDRNWAAFGVQGLAPYWFGIEATAYAGDAGRTALRVEVEYDLSLTQRLILQPRLELNAYGKDDPAARIGSGLSDAELGLRLRYEVRREIAPYIGIERVRRFGTTASFVESDSMDAGDTRWVVGVRVWY